MYLVKLDYLTWVAVDIDTMYFEIVEVSEYFFATKYIDLEHSTVVEYLTIFIFIIYLDVIRHLKW